MAKNGIAVEAIDDNGAATLVFSGIIWSSFADYARMPDVPLVMSATYGADLAVIPTTATSYGGSTDVVQIFQSLAQKMNLTFENNGVNGVTLDSPALNGGLITQMHQVSCRTPTSMPRSSMGRP